MRDGRLCTHLEHLNGHWVAQQKKIVQSGERSMAEPVKHLPPSSSEAVPSSGASQGWLQVGAIAAASALLGGLAAAWYYRRTLSRLREAEAEIPETRIIEDATPEDF